MGRISKVMSRGSFSTKYNIAINATISYGQFRFYNINKPKNAMEKLS
jgi:hypothetical protein